MSDVPTYEDSTHGLGIRLENFEGPMDLLLYLIRKNDLDIYDIPVADITREYLAYLDVIRQLDLDSAGNFLVMASTLMQIKSQLLLPVPESEEAEGPDPRAELVDKLLEYQRYKEAAAMLGALNESARNTYYRSVSPSFDAQEYVLKASVFDLLRSFQRVLESAPREVGEVLREEIPIEVKIREILDRLDNEGSLSFDQLFPAGARRLELIVTFLALLELMRINQIAARQSERLGAIRLFKVSPEVPAEANLEEVSH